MLLFGTKPLSMTKSKITQRMDNAITKGSSELARKFFVFLSQEDTG